MTGDFASPPDLPEGVAVIRKLFSTAELILAVHSTLAQTAELHGRVRELAELRVELNEAGQKASKT